MPGDEGNYDPLHDSSHIMIGHMVCFQCHSEGEERNGDQVTHADLAPEENKKKSLHKIGKIKFKFY